VAYVCLLSLAAVSTARGCHSANDGRRLVNGATAVAGPSPDTVTVLGTGVAAASRGTVRAGPSGPPQASRSRRIDPSRS
jgi:hypothetical protein